MDGRKEGDCDRKARVEPTPLIGISNIKMLYLVLFFLNPHFQTFSALLERSMTTTLVAACHFREPCTVTFHEIYAVICYLDSSLYDTPILRKHSKQFFFPTQVGLIHVFAFFSPPKQTQKCCLTEHVKKKRETTQSASE